MRHISSACQLELFLAVGDYVSDEGDNDDQRAFSDDIITSIKLNNNLWT